MARMRSAATEILKILNEHKLVLVEHMKNGFLAVHPSNRMGVGALPSDVHVLLSRIITDGFVWLECAGKIWGFQPQPGAEGRKQLEFNQRLAARAQGLLAPPGDDIRCLTIAGTHSTQGARCVEEETLGIPPSTSAAGTAATSRLDLWDQPGHLSKSKVLAANSAYGEFLSLGPEVTSIRWQVKRLCRNSLLSCPKRRTLGMATHGRRRPSSSACGSSTTSR